MKLCPRYNLQSIIFTIYCTLFSLHPPHPSKECHHPGASLPVRGLLGAALPAGGALHSGAQRSEHAAGPLQEAQQRSPESRPRPAGGHLRGQGASAGGQLRITPATPGGGDLYGVLGVDGKCVLFFLGWDRRRGRGRGSLRPAGWVEERRGCTHPHTPLASTLYPHPPARHTLPNIPLTPSPLLSPHPTCQTGFAVPLALVRDSHRPPWAFLRCLWADVWTERRCPETPHREQGGWAEKQGKLGLSLHVAVPLRPDAPLAFCTRKRILECQGSHSRRRQQKLK